MLLCLALFFLLLPENCLVAFNMYKERTRAELPVSLVMLHVYLLHLLGEPLMPTDPWAKALTIAFLLLLAFNLLTYTVAFACYLLFSVYLLVNLFRNPPMVEQYASGLNKSEMKRLKRVGLPERDSESNSENPCSIC